MISRLNLLPDELSTVKKGSFYFLAAVSIIIFAAILYFDIQKRQSGLSVLREEASSLQKETALLAADNAKYKEVADKINITDAKKKEMEGKVVLLSAISEGRTSWTDVLYELSNIVPSGVWLSGLSSFDAAAGDGKVKGIKINGMAFTNGLISDLMAGINASHYLEGAAMTYAQNVDYQGREAFSFEITFRLRRNR